LPQAIEKRVKTCLETVVSDRARVSVCGFTEFGKIVEVVF
jgi:hypothetical protein